MNEERLLSVLERIAAALERFAPAELDLPFDQTEADDFNELSDSETRDFWEYLESNPDAMAAYEDSAESADDNVEEASEDEPEPDECDDYYDDDPWDQEEHCSKYAGTYAHDVANLSDEFIDDVLDGEPEAYWNLGRD